ncbi:hypothetical protein E2C01_030581 [Portunus trituberculatus]|uniref:Uncharacterized protein n=1 Tax=Portunus trituberculatus TaxID=210409 RepID=A0A5B7EV63_PORTR|nr:hypothetical protein [Portunus trituberculatus]
MQVPEGAYALLRKFFSCLWFTMARPRGLSGSSSEELGVLQPVGNPAVSVSSSLLAQMEKVCGSMADIAFWTDQRQAVVDLLPCAFSDREKLQLLSSPFSDVLFDPAVVVRVQEDEH